MNEREELVEILREFHDSTPNVSDEARGAWLEGFVAGMKLVTRLSNADWESIEAIRAARVSKFELVTAEVRRAVWETRR